MRKNCQFQKVEGHCDITNNSLVITLLNVRSLMKQSIDVSFDNNLMQSNIIGFTETQLSHDCRSIDQDLYPLKVIINNLSQNTYSDIAFAHRDTLSLSNIDTAPSVSFLQ